MELTKDQIRKAALREQIQQEIAGSYSKLPSPSQIIALADRILAIIDAQKAGEMSDIEWDASRDSMLALGPCVRMRAADGWELHSWNVYTQMAGGGRITPYPKEMFYAVWKRRQP